MNKLICLSLSITALSLPQLRSESAAAWPQWRGPNATGAAPESSKPPTTWSENENIRWKIDLPGQGNASPIIWGNTVFILAAVKTDKPGDPAASAAGSDASTPRRGRGPFGITAPATVYQFQVLAIDRASGKSLWTRTAAEIVPHEGTHPTHGFASASPCTDGEILIVPFGSRGLFAYDLEGNLLWKKNLGRMTVRGTFGEGSSPFLFQDKLVVPWDHEGDSFIAVLDKKTGDELWRRSRDEKTTWATPLVVQQDGNPIVVTSGDNAVRAYDLASGELVWTAPGLTERPVCSPASDGTHVFVGSGYRGAALYAVKLGGSGDLAGSDHIVWSKDQYCPDIPSLLLTRNGNLYYTSRNQPVITCTEAATGENVFDAQRIDGLGEIYASPVAAGGHVYLTDREGNTAVFKDHDDFGLVSVNRIDAQTDASPAVSGNDLLLRGKHKLYCIAADQTE